MIKFIMLLILMFFGAVWFGGGNIEEGFILVTFITVAIAAFGWFVTWIFVISLNDNVFRS